VEQNGAGSEAEVGDVGSELKPLQTREGIKDNMMVSPLQERQTKGGWKKCLPPNAQCPDPPQQ